MAPTESIIQDYTIVLFINQPTCKKKFNKGNSTIKQML